MKRTIAGFALAVALLFLLIGLVDTFLFRPTHCAVESPTQMPLYVRNDPQFVEPDTLRFVTVESEPEEHIKISDYFPSKTGSTWTYSSSCGGTLTVRIAGTEKICGMQCIRLEAVEVNACPDERPRPPYNSGPHPTRIYFTLDDSGLSFARYLLPSGAYTEYCPPLNIVPAEVELGDEVAYSHYGARCMQESGKECGKYDGEGNYHFIEYEDMETPAGSFPNCLRVKREYQFRNTVSGGSGIMKEETWHAKGIGVVKRIYAEKIEAVIPDGSPLPRHMDLSEFEETYLLEKYSIPK